MSSVKVSWNPYESHWEAEANWSMNVRLVGEGLESPTDALISLIELLKDEIQFGRDQQL